MMYIYTVYEFSKKMYICIYTLVYENCDNCIYSVYIHAIYTLFVYIIYTYRHPRLKNTIQSHFLGMKIVKSRVSTLPKVPICCKFVLQALLLPLEQTLFFFIVLHFP